MPRHITWLFLIGLSLSIMQQPVCARSAGSELIERRIRDLERAEAKQGQPAGSVATIATTATAPIIDATYAAQEDDLLLLAPKIKPSAPVAPSEAGAAPTEEAAPAAIVKANIIAFDETQLADAAWVPTSLTSADTETKDKARSFLTAVQEKQKELHGTACATVLSSAKAFRGMVKTNKTQALIKQSPELQTALLEALLLNLDRDAQRFDIPPTLVSTNPTEKKETYEACVALYAAVLEEWDNLFPKPADSASPDDWFTGEGEPTMATRLYHARPRLQRRKDAFVQALKPLSDNKAAVALRDLLLKHLNAIDYAESIEEAVTTIKKALAEESTRDLIGKYPHLRALLFFIPAHASVRPRGVLFRYVPAINEATKKAYLELLEILKKNPRDTGRDDLDPDTKRLIAWHLDAQINQITSATVTGAPAVDAGSSGPAADEVRARQNPLNGKEPLLALKTTSDADKNFNVVYQMIEEVRAGMHGSDAALFKKAIEKAKSIVFGGLTGILGNNYKNTIKKSSALQTNLLDLLLLPLRAEPTLDGSSSYEFSLHTEASAITAALEFYKKIIDSWDQLFLAKDWLEDIKRRHSALNAGTEKPLTPELRAFFTELMRLTGLLDTPEGVAEGAIGLSKLLVGKDAAARRKLLATNSQTIQAFFSEKGILKKSTPPLPRPVKEAYLAVVKELLNNPSDTGLKGRTADIATLGALRKLLESATGTDMRYPQDKNAQTLDDALIAVGSLLFTTWPLSAEGDTAMTANVLRDKTEVLTTGYDAIASLIDKEAHRQSLAKFQDLRRDLLRLVTITDPFAEQFSSSLTQPQKESLGKKIMDIIAILITKRTSLNIEPVSEQSLRASRVRILDLTSPLTDTALNFKGKMLRVWDALLAATADDSAIEAYEQAVNDLFKLVLDDNDGRTMLKNFTQLRTLFFDKFLAWKNIPEGLSVAGEQATKTLFAAIRKNDRDLGYATDRALKQEIIDQLTELEKDLAERGKQASLSAGAQSIIDALKENLPRLTSPSDIGEGCNAIMQAIRAALEADKEIFAHYPILGKTLLSSSAGILVIRDIPEGLDDLNKEPIRLLLKYILDNPRDLGYAADKFMQGKLEKLMQDLENREQADLDKEKAAKDAAAATEAAAKKAKDDAEAAAKAAAKERDADLSLSGSGDDVATGSYGSGGIGGMPGTFNAAAEEQKLRSSPWVKPSKPRASGTASEELLKDTWAASVYNYIWQNAYKLYYSSEAGLFIKTLSDYLIGERTGGIMSSLIGGIKSERLRGKDELAKLILYYTVIEPAELPTFTDAATQKTISDFYTYIKENRRLFEVKGNENTLSALARLDGIIKESTNPAHKQVLAGIPPQLPLPTNYDPNFIPQLLQYKQQQAMMMKPGMMGVPGMPGYGTVPGAAGYQGAAMMPGMTPGAMPGYGTAAYPGMAATPGMVPGMMPGMYPGMPGYPSPYGGMATPPGYGMNPYAVPPYGAGYPPSPYGYGQGSDRAPMRQEGRRGSYDDEDDRRSSRQPTIIVVPGASAPAATPQPTQQAPVYVSVQAPQQPMQPQYSQQQQPMMTPPPQSYNSMATGVGGAGAPRPQQQYGPPQQQMAPPPTSPLAAAASQRVGTPSPATAPRPPQQPMMQPQYGQPQQQMMPSPAGQPPRPGQQYGPPPMMAPAPYSGMQQPGQPSGMASPYGPQAQPATKPGFFGSLFGKK